MRPFRFPGDAFSAPMDLAEPSPDVRGPAGPDAERWVVREGELVAEDVDCSLDEALPVAALARRGLAVADIIPSFPVCTTMSG